MTQDNVVAQKDGQGITRKDEQPCIENLVYASLRGGEQ